MNTPARAVPLFQGLLAASNRVWFIFAHLMNFSELLEVEEMVYSFSFSELPNPGPRKYFVRVSNHTTEFLCFELREKYGRWVVMEPALPGSCP